MKIGDTEIPIQSLRRRYKELQGQDPNTESSKMESEFAVSPNIATAWLGVVYLYMYLNGWSLPQTELDKLS